LIIPPQELSSKINEKNNNPSELTMKLKEIRKLDGSQASFFWSDWAFYGRFKAK
jgi:hypothetical protein